jgi:uncharacterized membrane protein YphA (DoxX/SURF4 family)
MEKRKSVRWLLTILLIAIGWHFLFEGMVKLLTPEWSAVSYLKNATGPFKGFFGWIAENTILLKIANVVNVYGQIVIGILLIAGLFVRYAGLAGFLLLMMYYFSNPPFSPTSVGYGIEGHYMIIDKNLIEALTLLVLSFLPKSSFFGLQQLLHKGISANKQAKSEPAEKSSSGYPVSRREILQNMVSLPVLSLLFLSVFRLKKSGIDAISGATDFLMEDFVPEAVADQNSIYVPNIPMGEGKGIFPGRVVWVWDPEATNGECQNKTHNDAGIDFNIDDTWYMDKNNNQERIDQMLVDGLCSLTGKRNVEKAWQAIFKYHNHSRGKDNPFYVPGEKVFIKLNRTSAAWGWNDDYGRLGNWETLCSETSPHVVLSILRQLVNNVGVPEEDIFVGDPMTSIFNDEFEKYHNEFPGVKYMARTGSFRQRERIGECSEDQIFYSDLGSIMKAAGSDKVYQPLYESEYLISVPALKGHDAAGISLCTKNHFGTQARPKALHLHPGLNKQRKDGVVSIRGYGNYRVLVDLMGSRQTGTKNLIYLIDGLWSGGNWNGPPEKFHMAPFNNHWSSSLILSLDPVAIESVGFDFLRTEFSRPEHNYTYVAAEGTDDYLHQAADPGSWPEGIVYSPDGPGKKLASLGVHEHWNNPTQKLYSRDIGKKVGIEFIKVMRGEQT